MANFYQFSLKKPCSRLGLGPMHFGLSTDMQTDPPRFHRLTQVKNEAGLDLLARSEHGDALVCGAAEEFNAKHFRHFCGEFNSIFPEILNYFY